MTVARPIQISEAAFSAPLQSVVPTVDLKGDSVELPFIRALSRAVTGTVRLSSNIFNDIRKFQFAREETEELRVCLQLRQKQYNDLRSVADRAFAFVAQSEEDLRNPLLHLNREAVERQLDKIRTKATLLDEHLKSRMGRVGYQVLANLERLQEIHDRLSAEKEGWESVEAPAQQSSKGILSAGSSLLTSFWK